MSEGELSLERQRRTLADLLRVRGHAQAAGIVAASIYGIDQIDNWNGGQLEVTLAVPVSVYDLVNTDMQETITEAARVIVGEAHFAGLAVTVRLSDFDDGWDLALLEALRATPHNAAERSSIEGGQS
jgi:hypothetical protein